jgi:hypothetical protein
MERRLSQAIESRNAGRRLEQSETHLIGMRLNAVSGRLDRLETKIENAEHKEIMEQIDAMHRAMAGDDRRRLCNPSANFDVVA